MIQGNSLVLRKLGRARSRFKMWQAENFWINPSGDLPFFVSVARFILAGLRVAECYTYHLLLPSFALLGAGCAKFTWLILIYKYRYQCYVEKWFISKTSRAVIPISRKIILIQFPPPDDLSDPYIHPVCCTRLIPRANLCSTSCTRSADKRFLSQCHKVKISVTFTDLFILLGHWTLKRSRHQQSVIGMLANRRKASWWNDTSRRRTNTKASSSVNMRRSLSKVVIARTTSKVIPLISRNGTGYGRIWITIRIQTIVVPTCTIVSQDLLILDGYRNQNFGVETVSAAKNPSWGNFTGWTKLAVCYWLVCASRKLWCMPTFMKGSEISSMHAFYQIWLGMCHFWIGIVDGISVGLGFRLFMVS